MRTGDKVKHKPSGETWTVAYVDGDHLSWCGWPVGTAKVADCELLESCTDEEHSKLLREIAALNLGNGGYDRRQAMCQAELERTDQAYAWEKRCRLKREAEIMLDAWIQKAGEADKAHADWKKLYAASISEVGAASQEQ